MLRQIGCHLCRKVPRGDRQAIEVGLHRFDSLTADAANPVQQSIHILHRADLGLDLSDRRVGTVTDGLHRLLPGLHPHVPVLPGSLKCGLRSGQVELPFPDLLLQRRALPLRLIRPGDLFPRASQAHAQF